MSELNKRELSMEEADKVVGGKAIPGPQKGTVLVDGKLVTEYDFYNAYMELTRLFGYDIAINQFYINTGFTCTEMNPQYHWGGDKSDLDKMDIVLNRFWLIMDGESHH